MQYLNILVGSQETPHVSYLCDCQPLLCAPDSNNIAQAVDDAVRSLGIILKSLYRKLFHVICVAHLLLHNRDMKVISHFENVD